MNLLLVDQFGCCFDLAVGVTAAAYHKKTKEKDWEQ